MMSRQQDDSHVTLLERNGRRLLLDCFASPQWEKTGGDDDDTGTLNLKGWHCPGALAAIEYGVDAVLCSSPEGAVGIPFLLRQPSFRGQILMTTPVKQYALTYIQDQILSLPMCGPTRSKGSSPVGNQEQEERETIGTFTTTDDGFLVIQPTMQNFGQEFKDEGDPLFRNFTEEDMAAMQRKSQIVHKGERFAIEIKSERENGETIKNMPMPALFALPCDGGYVPGSVNWKLCSGSNIITVLSSPMIPRDWTKTEPFQPRRSCVDETLSWKTGEIVLTTQFFKAHFETSPPMSQSQSPPQSLYQGLAVLAENLWTHRVAMICTEAHPFVLDLLQCFSSYFRSGNNLSQRDIPRIVFASKVAHRLVRFSNSHVMWMRDQWQNKISTNKLGETTLMGLDDTSLPVEIFSDVGTLDTCIDKWISVSDKPGEESIQRVLFVSTNTTMSANSFSAHIYNRYKEETQKSPKIFSDIDVFPSFMATDTNAPHEEHLEQDDHLHERLTEIRRNVQLPVHLSSPQDHTLLTSASPIACPAGLNARIVCLGSPSTTLWVMHASTASGIRLEPSKSYQNKEERDGRNWLRRNVSRTSNVFAADDISASMNLIAFPFETDAYNCSNVNGAIVPK